MLEVTVLVMGPNEYKGLENSNFGRKKMINLCMSRQEKSTADLHAKMFIQEVINLKYLL